jgi:hypothetical protein
MITVSAAIAMSGCAITSSYSNGPHGGSVHMIDGISAGAAYHKADKLCPSGYNVLQIQGQTSPLDYTMTVECKVPGGEIASR